MSVSIPEGYESVAFFSRLCKSGMLQWVDIKNMTMRQCYEIALMVDWQDMSERKANLAVQHG